MKFAEIRAKFDELEADSKLILISAIGVALLTLWGAVAQVDEVTRGIGKVIPSSRAQLVQAADPAVVREILVRSGQHVKMGQLLVRLDDSEADSALGQLETENERLAVRADRLGREAQGEAGRLGCEPGSVCDSERGLQEARVAAAKSQQRSLSAAIEQRRRDLGEANATVTSLSSSVTLAREEMSMLQPLAEQGIIPRTELLTAQREVVDLQGRLAAARQGVARSRAAVRQAQADLSSAELDYRQQTLAERSEVEAQLAINQETIRGAVARRDRNELRAPADGVVNDVQISTVGGFVAPGELLMQVIPVGEKLLIEARVKPRDIGFISVGDPAMVKVTAYDFSIFGALTGKVQQVSADSIYDEVDREAYYTVLVETDESFISSGGSEFAILPGMVCEIEIITGRKSVLSYLFKPISKAFGRALTER